MLRKDLSIEDVLKKDWAHDEELVESLWWDWFCPRRQLFRRGTRLLERLREISDSPLFDKRRYRTFFKNVCMQGALNRDHFYVVPMDEDEEGLPWFDICPPRRNGKQCTLVHGITGSDRDGDSAFQLSTWGEILDIFGTGNSPKAFSH